MMLQRGDIVIVDFPQAPGAPSKRRPALVVQSDHNNTRLTTAVFVMISTNIRLAGIEATQVLIDVATSDGLSTGLARNSAVKCENIYTLPQSLVVRTIGRLSAALAAQVDAALKASLALP